MDREFWINLSAKDLSKSRDFFEKLGFTINSRHNTPDMVSLFVGNKNIVVNLFPEHILKSFMNTSVTDTQTSNEAIFSLGANSPEEVDAVANKAIAAGAILYAKPAYKDGWLYGCGFTDLDGHRWNILYMDISKFPKGS